MAQLFSFEKEVKPLTIESFIAPALALGILLAAASAVTASLAYWATARNKRPSIIHAVLASFIVPSLILFSMMVYCDGLKVLTADYWIGGGKCAAIEALPPILAINIAACLIPSTLVIVFFQRWLSRRSS